MSLVRNFIWGNCSKLKGIGRVQGLSGTVRNYSALENTPLQPLLPKPTSIPKVTQVIAQDESLQSPDYFQVHNLFTAKELFEARVHLGHKIRSLNRLVGSRFDTVIFDLHLIAHHLRQALTFAAHIAYNKGIILFMTRSPQTMNLVERTAIGCGEYAHTRGWETTIFTDSIHKFGGITRLPDLVTFMNTLTTLLSFNATIKDAAKMLIPTIGARYDRCSWRTPLSSLVFNSQLPGMQSVQSRGMASLAQMHYTGPHRKVRPLKQPLGGRPQMKGVVLKTLIKKPKKPNSANRKCVLVRLSDGREVIAYVPGIGHNLQEHNIVLVRVGRLQDVPGVKLKCVRGVYDLPHVIKQKQA